MKLRVKFRFVENSGPNGKLAVNLNEGEVFAFTDATLGIESSADAPRKVHLLLTVKDMATYLRAGVGVELLTVNGSSGDEFILHPGDIVSVSGKKIEFLDIPERAGEEPDTLYLDVNDYREMNAAPLAGSIQIGNIVTSELHEEVKAESPLTPTVATQTENLRVDVFRAEEESLGIESDHPIEAATRELQVLHAPFHPPEAPAEVETKTAPEAISEAILKPTPAPPPLTESIPAESATQKILPDLDELPVSQPMPPAFQKPSAPRNNSKSGLGWVATLLVAIGTFAFIEERNAEGPVGHRAPPIAENESHSVLEPDKGPKPEDKYGNLHQLIGTTFIKEPDQSVVAEGQRITQEFQMDKTRFFSAVRYGDLATVKSLIDSYRVNPEVVTESGATPLMQAAYYGQLIIVKYFVELELDIDAQDPSEATALFYAARGNRPQTVRYLLSQGADPMSRTKNGTRAIDIAKKSHFAKVAAALTQAMAGRNVASEKPEAFDAIVEPN